LVNLVPRRGLLLLGADSPDAAELAGLAKSPVETFGLSDSADWQAHALQPSGTGTRFAVRRRGAPFGRFVVPLLGEHNVRNALAALAVGHAVGISDARLADGFKTFRGVKRRLEVVGTADGITVIDDFAHHPTAITETLAGLRQANPGRRIWAVFEPRSASSCRRVFQADFAKAFRGADEVVLAAVFRGSLPAEDRLSVEQLVADLMRGGQRARSIPDVPAIVETLVRECRADDLVVLMSNGGFGGIHGLLLEALRVRENR
jgi:UDP-N-acetylmuramate: L-alanyl-gamma-D-glutamyl-meso-diaminopimelate ligase